MTKTPKRSRKEPGISAQDAVEIIDGIMTRIASIANWRVEDTFVVGGDRFTTVNAAEDKITVFRDDHGYLIRGEGEQLTHQERSILSALAVVAFGPPLDAYWVENGGVPYWEPLDSKDN